jgi:hypothetical protein
MAAVYQGRQHEASNAVVGGLPNRDGPSCRTIGGRRIQRRRMRRSLSSHSSRPRPSPRTRSAPRSHALKRAEDGVQQPQVFAPIVMSNHVDLFVCAPRKTSRGLLATSKDRPRWRASRQGPGRTRSCVATLSVLAKSPAARGASSSGLAEPRESSGQRKRDSLAADLRPLICAAPRARRTDRSSTPVTRCARALPSRDPTFLVGRTRTRGCGLNRAFRETPLLYRPLDIG